MTDIEPIQITMATLHNEWSAIQQMTGCSSKAEFLRRIDAGAIIDASGRRVVIIDAVQIVRDAGNE